MGLTINCKGTHLEKVSFEQFDISLLAREGGLEIMIQSIAKDNLFYIYPGDSPGIMEFFYILKGEMICEVDGDKVMLGPHDYYTAINIEEPVHFTTLSDVMYLWMITEPVFYQLSDSINSLKGIIDEVEKKDRYTHKHSERVSEYSIKIAKKLKLSKEQLENLYVSSLLHDIGKINTPSEILNKPERLTDEEFEIMKRHPLDAADLLKDFYNQDISFIIAQHHERLNGTGYPHGLKDDDISLEARIIAVSDTFDAMTEDRVYRSAFNAKVAADELTRLKGTHYDPMVVDAFLEVLKEEDRI